MKTIDIKPLTREAFAPFGQVIEQEGQSYPGSQTDGHPQSDVERVAGLGRSIGSGRFLDNGDSIGADGLFQTSGLMLSQ